MRIRLATALAATLIALIPGQAEAANTGLGAWSPPHRLYGGSDIQSPGYSYAPSVIVGWPKRIYTCHSRSNGYIRDDIFLTTFHGNTRTSSRSVLTGTSGWDGYHNCDPSVVRVNVPYQGHTYAYAMFYLGNDVDASAHNAIGVAVADSLDGPWHKLPGPLLPFTATNPNEWGTGQPTATTIDPNAGTVVLAWTDGYSTGTVPKAAMVDFSSGTPVVSARRQLPTAGLTQRDGTPDVVLNNFDIAYNPARDRFYAVRDGHPGPADNPNYIADHVQVVSISGADFWNATGSWRLEGTIAGNHPRTHNAGIARNEFGMLPDDNSLTIVYTSAERDPNSLWTYTLWETTAPLT